MNIMSLNCWTRKPWIGIRVSFFFAHLRRRVRGGKEIKKECYRLWIFNSVYLSYRMEFPVTSCSSFFSVQRLVFFFFSVGFLRPCFCFCCSSFAGESSEVMAKHTALQKGEISSSRSILPYTKFTLHNRCFCAALFVFLSRSFRPCIACVVCRIRARN